MSNFIVCGYEGYFARWATLRKILYQFLDVEKKTDDGGSTKKQILSLGAGFDTTYFQLQVLIFPCDFHKYCAGHYIIIDLFSVFP